ncbi:MAG: serine/threonine-protein kinase [Pseudomonadota bacterium]
MTSPKLRSEPPPSQSPNLGRDASGGSTVHTGSPVSAASLPEADLGSRLIGRLLCGKWRVERLLGVGGMSLVYAASHRNGNRVALKVLKPELAANATVRQRFLREGYLANRVGHEGAAAVLDDNATEDGLFFLVMELISGETLEAYRQRFGDRLPAQEVALLSAQLLEVVAAAHRNNIVHRDIKPSNVFRTPQGQIKLLDFGIATLRDTENMSHTASGALLGTPAFMSPEQARGRHAEVDARADVWAVGATMFVLLSGRLVHVRETPHETMIATATEPAQALAALCPELSKALTRVVDSALQLDPERRFQSAASMLAALQALGVSESHTPPQSESQAAAAKRRPARWLYVPLAVAGSAALALGARGLDKPSPVPSNAPLQSRAPDTVPSSALTAAPVAPVLATSAGVSPKALPTAAAGSDIPPVAPPKLATQRPSNSAHAAASAAARVPFPAKAPPEPAAPPAPSSTAVDLKRILGTRR